MIFLCLSQSANAQRIVHADKWIEKSKLGLRSFKVARLVLAVNAWWRYLFLIQYPRFFLILVSIRKCQQSPKRSKCNSNDNNVDNYKTTYSSFMLVKVSTDWKDWIRCVPPLIYGLDILQWRPLSNTRFTLKKWNICQLKLLDGLS